MQDLRSLVSRREELLAELKTVYFKIEEIYKRKQVRCWGISGRKGCGEASSITSLVYLQTHKYNKHDRRHGGDYWEMGEGQFKCPHCGRLNSLRDREEVVKLKHYFADVKNVFDGEV